MKLPIVKAKEVIKALVSAGFEVKRQSGSHVSLAKIVTGRKICTVVPVHDGNELARGLLNDIIKQSGLTREEFLGYLKK